MPEKEFFNGFDDDILDPDEFEEEEDETSNEEENETEDDGKSEVENETEVEEESSKTEENSEEQAKTPEELEAEKKQQELHERNEREKAKRLERERKEREEKLKKDAKLEAELGLVKRNTYTDTEIKDEEDLEIFKMMKKIDEDGGDPVNDLPKAIAEKNRKAKEEAKRLEEEKANENKKVQEEISGFHSRHKDITIEYLTSIGFDKVVDDPKYDGFSYAERVYDFINSYNSAKKKSDDEKDKKVIDESSKKMTKVPSSQSNGGKAGEIDYLDMSDEEYLKREKEESLDFF